MPTDLDAPTLTATSHVTTSVVAERLPALTILWHPDPSRVGARFSFVDLPKSRTVSLSRLSPSFTAPNGESAPLADSFLSRQPMIELQLADHVMKVVPLGQGLPTALDGKPLVDPVSLPEKDLSQGVVLTLGRRIALCLHLADPKATSKPDLGLLGVGDAMVAVRQAIRVVADLPSPVLIRGETGTGKELTVAAVVKNGVRRDKPFLAVNIGALPPQLAAAEIFGHEKGAFTGAAHDRSGYFHEVDGGTLFLDEIGLASADVQTALLRVLETGEVKRLGARSAKRVDVRVLAATDAALVDQIGASGGFSAPLFHRLSAFTIRLPPLRDRREDLGVLLLHFLREALGMMGQAAKLETPAGAKRLWLDADVFPLLARAPWPGNVRQLRNFATQLAISNREAATARISPEMLATLSPPYNEPAPPLEDEPEKHSPVSHDDLVKALARHDFQPARAARALRVSRSTVYEHLRKDPNLGLLSRLSDEEFLRHVQDCHGDLKQVAKRLRVSYRAVQLRYGKA